MALGQKKSFNVADFKSSFKDGLTDQSLFEFKFTGLPRCLKGVHEPRTIQSLIMHTKKAQFPDMTISTNNVTLTGVSTKYPYEHTSADMQIEVISSANLWERKFFYDWQQKIVNYGIPAKDGSNFLVGYYDDYVIDAEITVFNKSGQEVSTVVLNNAWPMAVGVLDLDWATKDTVSVFYVTIGYAYWNFKEGSRTLKQ